MPQVDVNRQAFVEEAQELLGELETGLLELEERPEDRDVIDRVFRAMHTIKGSGAMFGFDDIAAFTHDVETVFDRLRNGELSVTKDLLDLTLASRDHIQALLNAALEGAEPNYEEGRRILEGMRRFLPASDAAAKSAAEQGPAVAAENPPTAFRIRFRPHREIFLSGTDPLLLLEELAELGELKALANFESAPPLGELDPEGCYVWWDMILTTTSDLNRIKDVFIFVEDDCELDISLIDAGEDDDPGYKKLGEILIERGDIEPEAVENVLKSQKRLGNLLTDAGLVSPERVESALAEQTAVREMRSGRQSQEAASSIRVAAEKLDWLVDLVGELVTVQAQISQVVAGMEAPVLTGLAEELERLSNELRDNALSIRMLPIGATFNKFRRLVRDLSTELGKQIDFETRGAETELDKTVIERLGDPLVHLLRNSIDHGVESPEKRLASGKPAKGTIVLSAEHAGGDVLIRIVDDGGGIDPVRVRAKAVERGLIAPDAELTQQETLNLIFEPGFSTAEKVTSVSGRGVGMDVVKRSIDSLRGNIGVQSEIGKGTTISIRLPLTLAIIDGLQVRVGDEFYVAPLTLVEECVELAGGDCSGERRIINLRGEIVPYVRLREWFESPGKAPDIEQIVVTRVEGGRVGLVVDQVVGEHQTVIKSLGRVYRDVRGISGATIKGDGSLALILDVPGLLRAVLEEAAA